MLTNKSVRRCILGLFAIEEPNFYQYHLKRLITEGAMYYRRAVWKVYLIVYTCWMMGISLCLGHIIDILYNNGNSDIWFLLLLFMALDIFITIGFGVKFVGYFNRKLINYLIILGINK